MEKGLAYGKGPIPDAKGLNSMQGVQTRCKGPAEKMWIRDSYTVIYMYLWYTWRTQKVTEQKKKKKTTTDYKHWQEV